MMANGVDLIIDDWWIMSELVMVMHLKFSHFCLIAYCLKETLTINPYTKVVTNNHLNSLKLIKNTSPSFLHL